MLIRSKGFANIRAFVFFSQVSNGQCVSEGELSIALISPDIYRVLANSCNINARKYFK
jgi:hypothetical protein